MSENGKIIALTFGIMCSIAVFNVCGITTTKYASAAQRSTIDTSRTVLIWIFSVWLGLEKFHGQAISGFVMLIFGTLLYNEILVLPVMGFDKNTKDAIAKREGISSNATAEENAGYMGLSPGKGHQGGARNSRNLQAQKQGHYKNLGDDGDYQMETAVGNSHNMSGSDHRQE